MNLAHVLLLALLQGVTELFPVSSLGHTVLIPGLLGWHETLSSKNFLPLVVALHIGTAAALLTFFWRDWVLLLRGGLRVTLAGRFTPDVDPDGYGRQFALVVMGTIPAGLIGLMLQKPLESLFHQPLFAASFLIVNGIVLLTVERMTRRRRVAGGGYARTGGISMGATAAHGGRPGTALDGGAHLSHLSAGGDLALDPAASGAAVASASAVPSGEVGKSLDQVTFLQAAVIGFAQAFALLPGISRSGATMVGGLAAGLSHEAAARFSFLLATPLIAAAGLLELPKLVAVGGNTLTYALLGGIVAGVAAYLSVRFLMRYFETNRLDPFAWYCMAAGALSLAYFALQGAHVIP